jgi:hypothetical protein
METNEVALSLRVSIALRDRIATAAKREYRSLAGQIRQVLAERFGDPPQFFPHEMESK